MPDRKGCLKVQQSVMDPLRSYTNSLFVADLSFILLLQN